MKESNSIKEKPTTVMQTKDENFFEVDCTIVDRDGIEKERKPTWKVAKLSLKKYLEEERKEEYKQKEMQTKIFQNQSHKCNSKAKQSLTPSKAASIISILGQMAESRAKVCKRTGNMEFPIIRFITQTIYVFLIKKILPQTISPFLLVPLTLFTKGMRHLK